MILSSYILLKIFKSNFIIIYTTKESELLQRAIELKRTVYRNLYQEANNGFLVKHSKYIEKTSFVSEYSPMIIASMFKDDITNLIKNDDVSWMDWFEEGDSGNELVIANKTSK